MCVCACVRVGVVISVIGRTQQHYGEIQCGTLTGRERSDVIHIENGPSVTSRSRYLHREREREKVLAASMSTEQVGRNDKAR
jgi:rRNA processing protein Gar1